MNFRNGLFLINLIHCVLISIYKNLIDPAISSLLSDNVVFTPNILSPTPLNY